MLNLKEFDINKVQIEKSKEMPNALIYSIRYNDDLLIFKMNNVKVPFGLEKYYNDYILKIQLSDELVKSIVYKIEEVIYKMDENKFKSQIKRSNNFEDLLTIKIANNKNENSIKNNDNSVSTIFDIKKNSNIDIEIYIDLIWFGKNSLVAKFKTKKITIL